MRFYGKEVRTLDNLIFYVSVKKTKYTDAIRRGNEGRKRNKTQSRASIVQCEASGPCFWPQTHGTSFWMVLILNPARLHRVKEKQHALWTVMDRSVHSLVGSPGTLSSAETTQSSRLDIVGRGDRRSLPPLPGTPS